MSREAPYNAALPVYQLNSDLPPKLASLPLPKNKLSSKWILSRDRRGMPPRVAYVRQMACLLLAQNGKPPFGRPKLGNSFINRQGSIEARYSRKYDHQRAKCKDPVLIRGWFQRVYATIAEYGVLEEDIYNFDEMGFQMVVITTRKVVTGTVDYYPVTKG
jgi:hypothetical protein